MKWMYGKPMSCTTLSHSPTYDGRGGSSMAEASRIKDVTSRIYIEVIMIE